MPCPIQEARVPVVLRVTSSPFATGAGEMDVVVECPHCGALHPVDLPDGADVSAPIVCPSHPRDMPLVGVRDALAGSRPASPAGPAGVKTPC
jgi:hypothetical protein